jgi:hypothetical protein
MDTIGGRRRTSVQGAATAADSARRQEGIGRLSLRPRHFYHSREASPVAPLDRNHRARARLGLILDAKIFAGRVLSTLYS